MCQEPALYSRARQSSRMGLGNDSSGDTPQQKLAYQQYAKADSPAAPPCMAATPFEPMPPLGGGWHAGAKQGMGGWQDGVEQGVEQMGRVKMAARRRSGDWSSGTGGAGERGATAALPDQQGRATAGTAAARAMASAPVSPAHPCLALAKREGALTPSRFLKLGHSPSSSLHFDEASSTSSPAVLSPTEADRASTEQQQPEEWEEEEGACECVNLTAVEEMCVSMDRMNMRIEDINIHVVLADALPASALSAPGAPTPAQPTFYSLKFCSMTLRHYPGDTKLKQLLHTIHFH